VETGKPHFDLPLSDVEAEQLTTAFAKRVGVRIRELREMVGLSLTDVAELGINRSTSSLIENGRLNLTAKTAVRFAAVLGVRPWELYVPKEASELRPRRGRSALPSSVQIESAARAFRKQIGKRVRSLRTLQGMSILTLSDLSGMSERTLDHIEDGITNLRASTAIRLADAIGVQPHELYLPTEQSGIRLSSRGGDSDA